MVDIIGGSYAAGFFCRRFFAADFFAAVFLTVAKATVTATLPDTRMWAVCLCADWCGLCRDYRIVLEDLAPRLSTFRFVWLDLEDHAELVGDLAIETFPTLLVADAAGILFFGPLTPQAQTLKRLLQSLEDPAAKRQTHTPTSLSLVDALPAHPQLHIRT